MEIFCDCCGEKIFRKPSSIKRAKHHFCSKKCNYKFRTESPEYHRENHPHWKGGKTELTCECCGKKFLKYLSCIKLYKHHFCSKECMYKFRSESAEYEGENSPTWNQIELACEYCGKKIYRVPSVIKRNKYSFCDQDCYSKYQSETRVGKNNFHFNSIERVCQQCGTKFVESPSRIKEGKGKYCSKKCFYKAYNTIETFCKYCGKPIKRQQHKLKNGRGLFCNVDCMAKAHSELDEYRGENHPSWKGGFFPYYGRYWLKSRRLALKRAERVSEISSCNGGLEVHHIIPLRKIVEKYFDLCLNPYMNTVKYHHLRMLPYDFIPELIFSDANCLDNLIVLTKEEHHQYEGMPLGFFKYLESIQ